MIKGGEFLIKNQESKDIFIPEDFSEDQLMMASATKEFAEKELDPYRDQFEKLEENIKKKVEQSIKDQFKKLEDLLDIGDVFGVKK